MAVKLVHRNPDVHCIRVPLPNNTLRSVNSYVVRDGGDTLVIDTGFDAPESYEALVGGFAELGFAAKDARLFVTHAHPDHYSLAAKLGCRTVYMHEDAFREVGFVIDGTCDRIQFDTALEMGFSAEAARTINEVSPLRHQSGKEPFEPALIDEGDVLRVGGYSFRAILTPGHAQGHLCLYEPDCGLLFTGDHILFDISPNISHWSWSGDTLADYLASLQKVRDVPVRCALPAHRNPGDAIAPRVDELLAHHEARSKECLDAIALHGSQNACEIARHLSWARGTRFDDMDPTQQLFAAGEVRAHAEHMVRKGLMRRERDGSAIRYMAE